MSRTAAWKHSLIWKITLSYLLLTVLPFILYFVLTFGYWWNNSFERTVAQAENLLHYEKNLIQTHLNQMRKLSVSIYYDQDLFELLQASDLSTNEYKQIQMRTQFGRLFQTMSETRSDIYNYYYFDLKGNLMYMYDNGFWIGFTPQTKYNPHEEAWFRDAVALNGSDLLVTAELPLHPPSNSYLSMARLIKHFTDPLGVILLDFNFDILDSTIGQSNPDIASDLMISDRNGHILYARQHLSAFANSDGDIPDDIRSAVISDSSGSFRTKIDDKRYLVVYDTLEPFSLKLVHLLPMSQLIYQPLVPAAVINLLIFLSIFLFITLSIYDFRRRLHPLRQLSGIMDGIVTEPFKQPLPYTATDEIGKLNLSFSRMMSRIDDLIETDYKNRVKILEAEKKRLEAQINPHFLYNTLDTIRFKSIEQGNADVADMLFALSKNLQYTITKLSKKVKVYEEIDWLERYIYLHKLRFRERFECFFAIDVAILDKEIYPLIIQPFVENAIVHGFKDTETGGILHINGYLDQRELICFEIVDNGCGFEDTIDRTYTYRDQERFNYEGIGIANVLNRLFLYYGNLSEVRLTSQPGKYTAVHIKLLQRPAEEE